MVSAVKHACETFSRSVCEVGRPPHNPVLLAALSLVVVMTVCLAAARATETGGGVIVGSVRLTGPAPIVPLVCAEQDLEVCGSQARPVQALLLGTNQTVRNAVVYLGASLSNGRFAPNDGAPAVLDQRGCEFVPRIQIARAGANLVLRNSDPVLHVVRIDSMSGTNGPKVLLNVATPYAGFEKKYQLANFREPTLLKAVGGNGHDWMAAYIAVMPHPWAALTDENGNFTLRGVPAGTHKLYAWHEVLGTLVREVKVIGDRPTTANFEFSSK